MINSLYQLSNKGSLRTLSFILALFLTAAFFLNLNQFSTALRTAHPVWILAIFWGLINLWIHGIGFEIRRAIWQLVFLPFIGYFTTIFTSLLGTLITFTISLPSISALTFSSARATSCNSSRDRSLATMSLARTFPLI